MTFAGIWLLFSVARLSVVATYPWIGDLVQQVGGKRVEVVVLARPDEDPHFVVPRPSLILKLRQADLLVVQGADLEVGFLPALVQQAANGRILPGSPGYLDLSASVNLMEVPQQVSRAQGDVHPRGNPHYHLDPRNIPELARAVHNALCRLDPEGCATYDENLRVFLMRWDALLEELEAARSRFEGKRAVGYHRLFNYWLAFLGANLVGTLEPWPGIPPTPGHIQKLLQVFQTQGVDWILMDVYHERKTADFLSRRTGVPVVVLPHDVGSTPDAKDLFALFRALLSRMEARP